MNRIVLFLFLASICIAAFASEILTGSVVVSISHEYKNIDSSKTLKDSSSVSLKQVFSYGTSTATAQVNGYFYHVYGLKSGTETVIRTQDLTDIAGEWLIFDSIKAIVVKNLDSSSTITVGSSTQEGLFYAVVPPGGIACWMAPYGGYSTATYTDIPLNTDGVASCEVSLLGLRQ